MNNVLYYKISIRDYQEAMEYLNRIGIFSDFLIIGIYSRWPNPFMDVSGIERITSYNYETRKWNILYDIASAKYQNDKITLLKKLKNLNMLPISEEDVFTELL